MTLRIEQVFHRLFLYLNAFQSILVKSLLIRAVPAHILFNLAVRRFILIVQDFTLWYA